MLKSSNVISRAPDGDDLKTTVKMPSERMASSLASSFLSPSVSGKNLTFVVKPPTASHILPDQRQRWQDNTLDRNKLEIGLDFGGNNLDNPGEVNAKLAKWDELTFDSQTADEVDVKDSLSLGDQTKIEFKNNEIHVESGTANFAGDAYHC